MASVRGFSVKNIAQNGNCVTLDLYFGQTRVGQYKEIVNVKATFAFVTPEVRKSFEPRLREAMQSFYAQRPDFVHKNPKLRNSIKYFVFNLGRFEEHQQVYKQNCEYGASVGIFCTSDNKIRVVRGTGTRDEIKRYMAEVAATANTEIVTSSVYTSPMDFVLI